MIASSRCSAHLKWAYWGKPVSGLMSGEGNNRLTEVPGPAPFLDSASWLHAERACPFPVTSEAPFSYLPFWYQRSLSW